DQSAEARAIRTFFETAKKQVLREFPHPFTTKFAALAELGNSEDEDWIYEWDYAYQYPSDCIYLKRILSGVRVESEDQAIPYRIVYGDAGSIILTDQEGAISEYTVNADVSRFPPDLVLAFSFLLAGLITPRLANADSEKGDKALQWYGAMLQVTKASAINEQRREKDPLPEMIRVRQQG